jgi:hypothetical protein
MSDLPTAHPEPEPPDPAFTRLSSDPLPRYRFVPGRSPHPRRDRQGHSYGHPEPRAERVEAAAWRSSRAYLFGIDLYNLGYFWESHEMLEALWNAAGSASVEKQFFQAIIQIAASNLKFFMGAESAGRALAERALAKLSDVPSDFMGLDVAALRREVAARIAGDQTTPPVLRLAE